MSASSANGDDGGPAAARVSMPPEPAIGERMQPGDRRPIASRDTAMARRFSNWLVAKRVSPNAISLAGMVAGLCAGAALAATASWPAFDRQAWLAAAALIQLRLLCNLFDGMVAIASGRSSPVGELYNDLPDRVSDGASLIGLGCATGGSPVLGLVAALAAMATAYVRVLGKATGAASDFRGPMAKQHRMFVVTVVALFFGVAPASWRLSIGTAQLPAIALWFVIVGSLVTAVRRLSGVAAQLRGGAR